MAHPDSTYLSLFHFLSSLFILYIYFLTPFYHVVHTLLCAGHYSCLCVPYTVMFFFMFVCPFGAGHILFVSFFYIPFFASDIAQL